jgi:hypothetical protein
MGLAPSAIDAYGTTCRWSDLWPGYGLDMGKESDRLIAAEEVLSELAQTHPKSGLVRRAIAAIQKWIRENVPGFENMRLSDSEIIELKWRSEPSIAPGERTKTRQTSRRSTSSTRPCPSTARYGGCR